ncbi:MAG: multi-sensor hybrid histidine kinase, partial [Verrucomicrobiales bacterium]|nr:multi-sensor hybrid histidine kinase [Verrucomicrobiales bacterium]
MARSVDNNEQERLDSLSKYDILDTPPESSFDALAALAAQFCHMPTSVISFVDRDREWIKSEIGTTLSEIPRDHAFASRAIKANDGDNFCVVRDAQLDELLRDNPLVKNEPHARFFAGIALVNREGVPLGALYVLDQHAHEFTDEQRKMLRALGHEAVVLLEWRRENHESRIEHERQSVELDQLKKRLQAEAVEHARVENELKRNERQLADAQRITHLGSWEWDLRTNSVEWSDELYRIYGVKPHEFAATYEAYLRFVHPDDRVKTNHAVERALVTEGAFNTEERIVRRDGVIRILRSCGEVIRNEKGEPVRMVGSCQDVTEWKLTQQKLQRSLSLLHATIDATADGILVVDTERRLVQVNRKFGQLWHLPAELISLYDDGRLLSLVGDQVKDPVAFREQVERVYKSPECESVDLLEFKDGRTFERYSCPQYLGEKVVGRVWSFRDITERVLALKVVQQSEQRYRSLVVATSQVVWTADQQGRIMEDSPSWRQFTGQSYAQMKDRGWLTAVYPRDRARVAELWDHATKSGNIYHAEFRLRRADSEWRFVSDRGVPVREKDGKIREWVGFCVDVTERKLAGEAILKERDFSDGLISSLPGIFYLLDETGLNLRWNENLERITGYSAQEISKMRAIDFVPPEEKALVAERVHKVFVTGEADVELNLLTKTGERIPFYCTGKLVHLDGKLRLIGAGVDVSGLKAAEAEIKRLNLDLEKRVQERTAQ